jgi:hypothetical protein
VRGTKRFSLHNQAPNRPASGNRRWTVGILKQ